MPTRKDAREAVTHAVASLRRTRSLPRWKRKEILEDIAAALIEQKERFAQLIVAEAGKPVRAARIEVERAILTFKTAAEEAIRLGGESIPLDLSEGGGNYTVVQLRLDELKTTANRLTVDVLVYPPDSVYDQRFDVLAKDVAVRLYPTSDLGDLVFPVGKAPAQVQTKIEAHGDPGNWPLDQYKTEKISADTFIGAGDARRKYSGRVEVTGALEGWDVAVARVTDNGEPDMRYMPGHPDANKDGFVAFPKVNPAEDMVDLLGASRSYRGLHRVLVKSQREIHVHQSHLVAIFLHHLAE